MRRERKAKSAPVQLFPFLAVLVSTMGALVLLLLVINRQAVHQAIAQAVGAFLDHAGRQEQSLLDRRAELDVELARLQQQLLEQEAESRSLVAGIQSRENDLQRNTAEQQRIQDDMDRLLSQNLGIQGMIADMRQRLLLLSASKERLARESQAPQPTFIPVVHPGTHGTTRQPIYLECIAQGVVLQPEGLVVSRASLDFPIGREALAKLVQVLSDYYLGRTVGPEHKAAFRDLEPYPLLLVRPDGIACFYLARSALEPLDLVFGYELVESDWKLQYPKPDPRVRRIAIAALQSGGSDPANTNHAGWPDGPNHQWPRRTPSLTPNLGGILGLLPGPSRSITHNFPPKQVGSDDPGVTMDAKQERIDPAGREPDPGAPTLEPDSPNDGEWRKPATVADSGSRSGPEQTDRADAEDFLKEPSRQAPRRGQSQPKTDRRKLDSATSGEDAHPPHKGTHGDSVLAMPGNPASGGKVTVPRNIEVFCGARSLVVGKNRTIIPVPESGPGEQTRERIMDEVSREMMSWGRPGLVFVWEPRLLCYVHADGMELSYWLRFIAAEQSIPVEHQIIAEDSLDWSGSWFLNEVPRHQRVLPPLWE